MTGEKTKSRVPQNPAIGHAARRTKYAARRPAAKVEDLRTRARTVTVVMVRFTSQSIMYCGAGAGGNVEAACSCSEKDAQ